MRPDLQVQKHAAKVQQEKEAKAMEKVGALMPQIGRLVHALALEECSWDVERAVLLLRQFHADNVDKLAGLLKVCTLRDPFLMVVGSGAPKSTPAAWSHWGVACESRSGCSLMASAMLAGANGAHMLEWVCLYAAYCC